METESIYRVRVRMTSSKQPSGTYWQSEVLYCGTDRTAARIAYHASEPGDYGGGYSNRARETIFEMIDDAGTDNSADDEVEAIEVEG